MNPPPSAPSPAIHPREDLYRFVNELNVRYNVGISIPDPSLTPAERKVNETSAGRIYRRLETHFFHGGLDALNSLLRGFDTKAKGLWSQWVKKPQGDADTLPRLVRPPLAANLQERECLQKLFDAILDEAPPSMAAPRRFGRTQSGPAALEGSASSARSTRDAARFAQPKRPADAELKDATKRPKAEPDPDPVWDLTAAASCFRQPTYVMASANDGASALANRALPATVSSRPGPELRQSFQSFASASTSTTFNPPSVFSVSGKLPATETQETIEASCREQHRPAGSFRTCSQQSYIDAPSSTMEEALLTSFNQHEASSRPPLAEEAKFPALGSQGAESSLAPSSNMVEAFRSSPCLDVSNLAPLTIDGTGADPIVTNQDRWRGVWPSFPSWLRRAPFPVAWEATRIAQSCGVDLATIQDMKYSDSWTDQQELRKSFARHAAFQVVKKDFPAASDAEAWVASLEQSTIMPLHQQVVYSASLDFSTKHSTLRLTIQPPKLELSHRLGRRFGADRFLELLVPSPESIPASAKNQRPSSFFHELVQHLQTGHEFCGRSWKAFYTKSGGSRKQKPGKEVQFGPDDKNPAIFKERIFFFAEEGCGVPGPISLPRMLDWALDLRRKINRSQPILKLFQRLALVLSKTHPTVVFTPAQIRHRAEDLLSPTGKVMNDGIARMSVAVARDLRKRLGLSATPSAVQGRLGSAKGMWIVDVTDNSDEVWIETFPSQRKWDLDWDKDHEHRTLEIRNVASMPRSASVNLQFLPVIEDRAVDKAMMRMALKDLLTSNLQTAIDDQTRAMQNPLLLRQWLHENVTRRHDRLIGHVPYLGGMPREDYELLNSMLDAGFSPNSNQFLVQIANKIQQRACETLLEKINIPVGRSAYLYMTVDFTGILAEDEVHIGFSTAYTADDDWSNTMVQGDVLVGRSPAHFISDIQRVRAVFKPELADLKDVVVFSSRGNIPLAEKLSGGDYDGDLAWVCWDSRIVDNFENADVPKQPDLSPYMPRATETFRHLRSKYKKNGSTKAVYDMMGKCFEFNLTKSMLGICTNYKERLCYTRNNVCDDAARTLSTLLSNLVDQAKQGIRFSGDDFDRLRHDLKLPKFFDEPLYRTKHWTGRPGSPKHILDYLKFDVAKPTIDQALSRLNAATTDNSEGQGPQHWDMDLATVYNEFAETPKSPLIENLKRDIETVAERWDSLVTIKLMPFSEKVTAVYALWQGIQPRRDTCRHETLRVLDLDGETSLWAQLKASTAFYMYYKSKPRFVWRMASQQLCHMKAQAVTSRRALRNAEAAPSVVIPTMYAALRPNTKFIKQTVATAEGHGSLIGFVDGSGNGDDGDDGDDGDARVQDD